jgi:ketosteroid isomerase-like protein
MQAICSAWLLTLTLPAQDAHQLVQVDWSRLLVAEPTISALRSEYVAAVNSRDESRVSTLYTSDALTAIPDGTVLRGADAIASRLRNRPPAVVTLAPHRIHADTNIASEAGTFTETLEQTVHGIYVTIYSRGADGRWRIAMEVRTTGSTPSIAVW